MELMRDPFLIFEVFGIAGILFFIYAGVLAFFLPFYVMGIYNQTKAVNKNLQTLVELFQTYKDRLELMKNDTNPIFKEKNEWNYGNKGGINLLSSNVSFILFYFNHLPNKFLKISEWK